jgi:RimJ/RimL family protein N-acetyltransferase
MYSTEHLELRACNEAEDKKIFEFLNDYDLLKGISNTETPIRPWTYEEFREDFKGKGRLAAYIKGTDDVVGLGEIWRYDLPMVASVMLFIKKEYRGKGYGRELLEELVRISFEEWNARKVKLCVYSFNTRALQIYKKVGFEAEGWLKEEVYRDGKYSDIVYMGLFRDKWERDKQDQEKLLQ